jgi:hypothetical protein
MNSEDTVILSEVYKIIKDNFEFYEKLYIDKGLVRVPEYILKGKDFNFIFNYVKSCLKEVRNKKLSKLEQRRKKYAEKRRHDDWIKRSK